jgi:hypothetical protein
MSLSSPPPIQEEPRPPAPSPSTAPPAPEPDRGSGIVTRAEEPETPRPTKEDILFVNALSACDRMLELDGAEFARIAARLGEGRGTARRIDLLELYYSAEGRESDGERRRKTDRFFVLGVDEGLGAHGIVRRLAKLAPELPSVELERIGDAVDGQLVLRAGDHFAAVIDDSEVEMDTGEIDLRSLDTTPTITVRGLVRAFNRLLDRHGVRERLVALASDESREAYVSAILPHAMMLHQALYLEDEDSEELLELGGW